MIPVIIKSPEFSSMYIPLVNFSGSANEWVTTVTAVSWGLVGR